MIDDANNDAPQEMTPKAARMFSNEIFQSETCCSAKSLVVMSQYTPKME